MGVAFAAVAPYLTAASAALSIGGALMSGGKKEPSVGPAPSPAADETASQDAARVSAVNKRRAIASGGNRSLLATIGGGAGDSTPASIGIATANPGTKSALGG